MATATKTKAKKSTLPNKLFRKMDLGLFGPYFHHKTAYGVSTGYIFEVSPRYWNLKVRSLGNISIPFPWTYGGYWINESTFNYKDKQLYLMGASLGKFGFSSKRIDYPSGNSISYPPLSNINSYGGPCGFTAYSNINSKIEVDHDNPMQLLNLGVETITAPTFNSDYMFHVTPSFIDWVAKKTKKKLKYVNYNEDAEDAYPRYLKLLKAWSSLTPRQMKDYPWPNHVGWKGLQVMPGC